MWFRSFLLIRLFQVTAACSVRGCLARPARIGSCSFPSVGVAAALSGYCQLPSAVRTAYRLLY